ncbi:MAG: hypothetical protein AAF721_35935 [Myxococcota bacterium]
MVSFMHTVLPDAGRGYAELAACVEAFLARTGATGWGELDVRRFVHEEALPPMARTVLCCELAGLLACLSGTEDLAVHDAARIWDELRDVCPSDPRAQRYLRLGALEFASGTREPQ